MVFTPAQITAIHEAVVSELTLHPKATLKDIYKNFFQDQFGPGHLMGNSQKSFQYLESEIQEAIRFEPFTSQQIGYQQRFVRFNLRLIKEGIIPIELFFTYFTKSASHFTLPDITRWREEWCEIISLVEQMHLHLPNFDNDAQAILAQLDKGKYVGHHSEVYQQTYQPHYRLITNEAFERLKLDFDL